MRAPAGQEQLLQGILLKYAAGATRDQRLVKRRICSAEGLAEQGRSKRQKPQMNLQGSKKLRNEVVPPESVGAINA